MYYLVVAAISSWVYMGKMSIAKANPGSDGNSLNKSCLHSGQLVLWVVWILERVLPKQYRKQNDSISKWPPNKVYWKQHDERATDVKQPFHVGVLFYVEEVGYKNQVYKLEE